MGEMETKGEWQSQVTAAKNSILHYSVSWHGENNKHWCDHRHSTYVITSILGKVLAPSRAPDRSLSTRR